MSRAAGVLLAVASLILLVAVATVAIEGTDGDEGPTALPTGTEHIGTATPGIDDSPTPVETTEPSPVPSPEPSPTPEPTATATDGEVGAAGSDTEGGNGGDGRDGGTSGTGNDDESEADDMPNTGGGSLLLLGGLFALVTAEGLRVRR